MFQTLSHFGSSHRYKMMFLAGLVLVLGFSSVSSAQQPTATISKLTGSVEVVVQGKKVEAKVGTVLSEGDTIETQAGAAVTLTLSDGSAIQLGENTKIGIDVLFQSPETDARQSLLKLLYGRIRTFLSFGHQKEGSDFTMETPNAQVGVKFSRPDVEVSYDPRTKTTIVRTYTVEVNVINLLTRAEIKRMPREHQAIIREEFILVTKITEISGIIEQMQRMPQIEAALTEPTERLEAERLEKPTEDRMNLLLETRGDAGTAGPATSQLSGPGVFRDLRTEGPESGRRPVDFTFGVIEE